MYRDRVKALKRVKACDLLPHPRQWRVHPAYQREALKGLLEEVGFAGALLVREVEGGKYELIDGHLRAETAPDMEVPVLVLDLDGAEADKLLASFDPLGAMARADQDKLLPLLASVQFESKAVKNLLEALANDYRALEPIPPVPEVSKGPEPQLDRADELREKWGTERGQIWKIPSKMVLGKAHRLMCGDSTSETDVARLMGGEKVALMVTDPPYAVDYVEKARDLRERGYGHTRAARSTAIQGDAINEEESKALWLATFKTAFAILNDDAAWYVWHAPGRAMLDLHAVLHEMGLLYHQTIIWVKPNFVIGRCDYQWKHEPCFYGWKEGHRPPFYGDKNQTTVWEIGRDTQYPDHPTQKPVAIFTPPILNHLKIGEAVYDPFFGSGTTMVAAEQLGRICYGMEIEPKYVAVALQRMADMGLEPRLHYESHTVKTL